MAFDSESGVAETYYRINNRPIQNISPSGQPLISVESTNAPECRIFAYDTAGNGKIAEKRAINHTYTVVPEFSPLGSASLFIIITLLVVAFREKHRSREEN